MHMSKIVGENPLSRQTDAQLREVFARFSRIKLAVLLDSVAAGCPRAESDLDIAVAADRSFTVGEKISLINELAEKTGRPVDLIDLSVTPEPLLGQILRHGRRILGSDTVYGELISRLCLSRLTSCLIGQDCLRKGGLHGSGSSRAKA
jgi:uncharacterized protein